MADQAGAASNSSDFVRKLYKMLEDPTYESVVRWGNEGDSFVVLENEKFTKSILPKHFKHSNFASFVRQLNKYDFHKVRHNNEDNGQSPYGPNAWEFRHPDFRANNKDALDNIRRKAPVPRKPNSTSDDFMPSQQVDMLNTQLVAVQQQLQTLQERYNELGMHHSMLLQEVIGLQKTVVNHEHVIQNVMSFLHSVDAQRRRESRILNPNPFAQSAGSAPQETQIPPEDDEPASPLQHASKLLNEINADVILNSRNLEQMNEISLRINGNSAATPPASEAAFRASNRQASREPPASASSTTSMRYADLETMVYPVGQNNGIDPMYSEHINNIPYSLPANKAVHEAAAVVQAPQAPEKKKPSLDPGWVRQPQILLVEDDPTCRRIGGKFLYAFNCSIDSALDGLEAVNKMNAGSKYDLVLMDIIMPNLDGVSACHLIRQFDNTPIIAMTSNIRSDDISMYFQHGMNDVLPKPFTKEGLLAMLEKHLGHLKKPFGGVDGIKGARVGPLGRNLKDEDSPGKTTSSWHNSPSTNTLTTGVSPVNSSGMGDEFMMRQGGASASPYGAVPPDLTYASHQQQLNAAAAQQQARHRRQISEISGGDEVVGNAKRQMFNQPMHTMPRQ